MPRTANTSVLEELRRRINRRTYGRGEFLPSERQLAEELGVGRCVIRGALSKLRQEGLAYRVPGKGLCVARHEPSGFAQVLVMSPAISAHPYEQLGLIAHACQYFDKRSVTPLIIFGDHGDPLNLPRVTSMLRDYHVDGLLLLEIVTSQTAYDSLRKAVSLPMVHVNQERFFGGCCCRMDFRGVGRLAGQRLLASGHRSVGTITGPLELPIYHELLAGFRGALAEEEVYLRNEDILPLHPTLTPESYRSILDYLRRPDRPAALFTMRDRRADFLYRAAGELGLRIPEQLSVISFDNTTWPDAASMGLTTIQQPLDRLSCNGAEMLMQYCLEGTPPESRLIPGTIVERASIMPM
ncbi:MAG: GntR family transcriptional regulator [Victivallales bacterium]|nr:GntR family transcriptional regulator [Victivallales bacterium]